MEVPSSVKERLTKANQAHLLDYWSELTNEQRQTLLHDINEIDFDRVTKAYNGIKHELTENNASENVQQESIDDLMEPVPDSVTGSINDTNKEQLERYRQHG